MAIIEREPLTSSLPLALPLSLLSPPPQAATPNANATASAAKSGRYLIFELLPKGLLVFSIPD